MNTSTLSNVLALLARADTMVPAENDRATLAMAAAILGDPERLVSLHGEPEIVIVAGEDHDPVAAGVDQLERLMGEARDTLDVMAGNLDDLRRLLRAK